VTVPSHSQQTPAHPRRRHAKPPKFQRELFRQLQTRIAEIAASLIVQFAPQTIEDERWLKQSAPWLLRCALPPKPGRPRDEEITRAVEMRAQGKSWATINADPKCIDPNLMGADRQLALYNLHKSVWSRLHPGSRRRQKNPPEFLAPKN